MNKRYLKNNGKPSEKVFPSAHYEMGKNNEKLLVKKKVEYFDEKGKKVDYWNTDPDRDVIVEDYPHVINYPYGPIGRPDQEKRITILVGQTVATSDKKLFEHLWKTFRFLDEVDEKGNLVKENTETDPKFVVKEKSPEETSLARALGEPIK